MRNVGRALCKTEFINIVQFSFCYRFLNETTEELGVEDIKHFLQAMASYRYPTYQFMVSYLNRSLNLLPLLEKFNITDFMRKVSVKATTTQYWPSDKLVPNNKQLQNILNLQWFLWNIPIFISIINIITSDSIQ